MRIVETSSCWQAGVIAAWGGNGMKPIGSQGKCSWGNGIRLHTCQDSVCALPAVGDAPSAPMRRSCSPLLASLPAVYSPCSLVQSCCHLHCSSILPLTVHEHVPL
jgi:hypothetical protein